DRCGAPKRCDRRLPGDQVQQPQDAHSGSGGGGPDQDRRAPSRVVRSRPGGAMTLSVRRFSAESSLSGRPIRVAQIITKLSAGAGSITLHGALALDSSRYAVTILAPEGGTLSSRAEAAGITVLPLRHMAPDLD